jgi:hypothetical protein
MATTTASVRGRRRPLTARRPAVRLAPMRAEAGPDGGAWWGFAAGGSQDEAAAKPWAATGRPASAAAGKQCPARPRLNPSVRRLNAARPGAENNDARSRWRRRQQPIHGVANDVFIQHDSSPIPSQIFRFRLIPAFNG